MHSPPKEFMHPGLRLRQARERLGLTYREVESASYELAARRGRSEFILHISRQAEIESYAMDTAVDGSTRMDRGS